MADASTPETFQLLSPDIQAPVLREVMKKAMDFAKDEIQQNDGVEVDLDCVKMTQKFGFFKEADLTFEVGSFINEDGKIWGALCGILIPGVEKFYSSEEVEDVSSILRDRFGLTVTRVDEPGPQYIFVGDDGDTWIRVDFGFKSQEDAEVFNAGRNHKYSTNPVSSIGISVFDKGKELRGQIEDHNNVVDEKQIGRIIDSVPKSLDLMTKLMQAINEREMGDKSEKLPKIINWVDTAALGPLEKNVLGWINNKDN